MVTNLNINDNEKYKLDFKLIFDEISKKSFNKKTNFDNFLDSIGRSDLSDKITEKTPWLYLTQEIYREKEFGIMGGGGLGVLAGDMTRVAEKIGLPLVVVTPFYSEKIHQKLTDFHHNYSVETVKPSNFGYIKIGLIKISTLAYPSVPLEVHVKLRNSMMLITLFEPNIGAVYSGESGSDHRLYHEAVTGFGGYEVIKQMGIDPPLIQMNESCTVFGIIAKLDDLVTNGMEFYTALEKVRQSTIYTNHTLLQAAEGEFHYSQFQSMIFPNIKNKSIIDWLSWQFTIDSKIKLSTLAIELSGKRNGVSILHSKISSDNYRNRDGNKVQFNAVTNGISDFWIQPKVIEILHKIGVLDNLDLPTKNYIDNLEKIDINSIKDVKDSGRIFMNEVLSHRQNQYGKTFKIPQKAKVFDIKRRLVSYKRAKMIFNDPDRLLDIIKKHDAYIIISGKPHSGDSEMVDDLFNILTMIANNPILKEHIYYVQNYDEELSKALAIGCDCAINVPVVGQEACGTSWMKDLANLKLLISTTDGGVADIDPPLYLEVSGNFYNQEADMLYQRIEEVCQILDDEKLLRQKIIDQLNGYLPIISGSRMIRDYLNLRFN